ncbi:MAG: peptidylprolyl isomerase [Pseudomonadota bacterium]
MKKPLLLTLAALVCALPLAAQEEAKPAPGPADIVNAAPQSDWVVIAPEDMLVMTLAPDRDGNERKVVLQLMPPPFSQGWVENIKTLARAKWYDGISINRVQDNYVVQWGDPNHDNPEAAGEAKKPLPEGLRVMEEGDYIVSARSPGAKEIETNNATSFNEALAKARSRLNPASATALDALEAAREEAASVGLVIKGHYSDLAQNYKGWPIASGSSGHWPVHCYGMVGVGRNYSPDTGTGPELYTVIGHAPRHLDRNIALVGRIISGMEHLSSLPRGSGALGFYTKDEAEKRTPILSIRVASDLPEEERPQYEYLSTETETFARYAEARANRRDPFFIHPAGGADICNIPVPVRAFEYTGEP